MNRNKIEAVQCVRPGELGGSKATLTIILVILFLGGYAGINYVPIAYSESDIKTQMQTITTNAIILPASTTNNNQVAWTTAELNHLAQNYDLPPSVFKAEIAGPAVKASINVHRKIPLLPFGLYNYEYDFVYSASSAGFGGPAK
jgi:hypothetical protein